MSFLETRGLVVGYGRASPVLHGFTLSLDEGELVSLLGPSGCGKTTALRAILGFIRPREGRVLLKGDDITDIPPYKRNFGVVYQSYALFPHLTVAENVAFGLRMRKVRKQEVAERVNRWLGLVGLEDFADRLPAQLSGGQRQRVALARALAVEPALLLLDEPLSNLDAKLRATMRVELRRIQKDLGITAIYVTHDLVEALSMSDRIAVLNEGRIQQIDTPPRLYRNPANEFVAHFMGYDNSFPARVARVEGGGVEVMAGGLRLQARMGGEGGLRVGDEVRVYFRPERVEISEGGPETGNVVPGEVRFQSFQGHSLQYVVETPLGEITVVCSEGEAAVNARSVNLRIDQNDLIAFRKE